jgi:hypothetical protein
MSVKPFSPSDVLREKPKNIPDFVITVVNELLVKKFDGSYAIIKRDTIINILLEKKLVATRQEIFENRWLDFEPIYENAGWKVEYDQPGYGDTDYDAYFKFTMKG